MTKTVNEDAIRQRAKRGMQTRPSTVIALCDALEAAEAERDEANRRAEGCEILARELNAANVANAQRSHELQEALERIRPFIEHAIEVDADVCEIPMELIRGWNGSDDTEDDDGGIARQALQPKEAE